MPFFFVHTVNTASALYQRGVNNIAVFEKALSLEPVRAAIGLFPNGFRALQAISATAHAKVKDACIENRIMRSLGLDGSLVRRERDFSKVDMVNATFLVWHLLQQFLAEDLEPGVLQLGQVLESFAVVDVIALSITHYEYSSKFSVCS